MELRFHRKVQIDLNEALGYYSKISGILAEDFFAEFRIGLSRVHKNPRYFHFDASGLRRYNLERFPYHLLYDIRIEHVRIWVLRHDHRKYSFGTRRFR